MADARQNNLLGALVLALSDRMRDGIARQLDMQGEAAAAVVSIGNMPGQSVEWLSHTLRLSHSGTVRLLEKLEQAGLVQRTRSAIDARALQLGLSVAGGQLAARILAQRRQTLDQALDALSPRERQLLTRMAEKILDAITVLDESQANAICRLCEESVCPQDRCPITEACSAP